MQIGTGRRERAWRGRKEMDLKESKTGRKKERIGGIRQELGCRDVATIDPYRATCR